MKFSNVENVRGASGFVELVDYLAVNVFRTAEEYWRLPIPYCRRFYSIGGVLFAASGGGFQRVFESYAPHAAFMLSIAESFFIDANLPPYATAVNRFFSFLDGEGIRRPPIAVEGLPANRDLWEAIDNKTISTGICVQVSVQEIEHPFYLDQAWRDVPQALLDWAVRNKSALVDELSTLIAG